MSNAKDYYNLHSYGYVQKWNELFVHSNNPANYFRRQLIDSVLQVSDIRRNSHVVEIGCGTGLVLRDILQHTDRVFGVDIAEAMLQRVADSTLPDKRVVIVDDFLSIDAYRQADVVLMEGDFRGLNLPENYFDRIISVEVLRYVDNIDRCFDYCRSIMHRDSIFVFTVTNFWSASLFPIKYTVRKLLGLTNTPNELRQYFITEKGLEHKLRKSGLQMMECRRVGFLTMNPLVRRFIRDRSAAANLYTLESRVRNLPIIKNFCDTLIVAAKKSEDRSPFGPG